MATGFSNRIAKNRQCSQISPILYLHTLFRLATARVGGDSLKKKGRFKVRRIRSGSREAEDDDDEVREEQSPGAKVRFVEYHPLLLGSASATTKIVAVYNVAGLFTFDRRLATQYRLRDFFSPCSCRSTDKLGFGWDLNLSKVNLAATK